MKDIQQMLQEGVQGYDVQKIATALAIINDDFTRYPDSLECNIHDVNQPAGACVVDALKTTVDNNYIMGMIVLFEPLRAQHVLETRRHNYNQSGVQFLHKLTQMFERNTNDLNDALATFWKLPAGNFVPSPTRIQYLIDDVQAAFVVFEAHEQNQRIDHEVQQHIVQSTHNKRKI